MRPPLHDFRVLVPPSRPELNPLLRMLQTKGAEVVEWPAIRVTEPQDYAPMDKAIREISRFDWTLFSGSNCVGNFLARLAALGLNPKLALSRNVAAVGHGALSRLKTAGIEVSVCPKRHVAEDVAAAIEEKEGLNGKLCLLVRVAGSSDSLPRALQARGAAVEQVEGYRLRLETDRAAAAWDPQPDLIAFANPAAVRLFMEALNAWGGMAGEVPAGVGVFCVGPATAAEARRLGLKVDSASGGSQADLVAELVSRFGMTGHEERRPTPIQSDEDR